MVTTGNSAFGMKIVRKNVMRNYVVCFIFFINVGFVFSQTTCQTAQLFCPNPSVTFSASVNNGNAQIGPNYGCLGSQPNPAWHYLQIASGGSLQATLSGIHDIDFICYGPFSTLTGICNNLTAGNTIDCSYSSSATETLTIPNANNGEFYLVMITNFSNVVQTITLTQTSGNAVLNCTQIQAYATTSLCSGNSGTVTCYASGLTNPTYSLNPGPQAASLPTFTVTPSVSTTYTIYCTGINSQNAVQTLSATASIFVSPSPTLATNFALDTICSGNSTTLFLNGATSYTLSTGVVTQNSSVLVSPISTTNYTIWGESSTGCISSTTTILTVINCNITGLAVKDQISGKIKLYPNPVNDKLNIQLPDQQFTNAQIINSIGKLVREIDITNIIKELTLNINDLPEGIYILKLFDSKPTNDKISVGKRFVIVR